MKLRRIALPLHRYFGIIAGVLLIIISITGSLLILNEDNKLDALVYPQLHYVRIQSNTPLSVQAVAEKAQKAYPLLKLHNIALPQTPNGVYTVMFESPLDKYLNVYVNPYNGKFLGTRTWLQTVQGFLLDLHVHLFAGDIGAKVVAICGIFLLVTSITGIVLWNGWKGLAQGLRIRWNSSVHILNYDLHKFGGILSVLLLILISFTGIPMIFWSESENFLHLLTRTPPIKEAVSKVVVGVKPLSIDILMQKATVTLPDGKIDTVYPPKTSEATFGVLSKVDKENYFNKTPYFEFDQYTGKFIRSYNHRTSPLPNQLMNIQYVLHTGNWGGLLIHIIYVSIGLTPAGLFITGFLIWRNRTLARVKRRLVSLRINKEK